MNDKHEVVNVVFAGLGGQGVIKASDILAEAAFLAGFDVKKSEIHGMSQRGGSVTSDVRYGAEVFSPMIPVGEAHVLLSLDATQVTPTRHFLSETGTLITPELILGEGRSPDDVDEDPSTPINRRNFNVAMLGALSARLDLPEDKWLAALRNNLPAKTHALNEQVFALGREAGKKI
jgi:indolepyruvate ferredoxin oxidoreductase beta subunit